MDTIWDIIVIGGGPAGMMAAGRAAERAREQGREIKILLLEKNDSLGKKLLITGGGRCNVTNAEFDDRALLAKFKDSSKFLFSAFAQHNVRKTLSFFNTRGMETKVEAEKRVFPVSDKAQSVWDVMVSYLTATSKDGRPSMVTIGSDSPVTGFVQTKPGIIDGVKIAAAPSESEEIVRGKAFIIATGGKSHPETGSTGEGFAWLAKAGHTIIEPTAALVPINVSDVWVKSLAGVSLPEAKLTLFLDGVKVTGKGGKKAVKKGKVLFTHFGMSGPAILNMSAEIGELLQYGEVVLSLDLLPEHDYATLNEALQRLFAVESNKKFKNAITSLIPTAFVPVIVERSGISPDIACNSVTREERLKLVKLLKDLHIHPTGLLGDDKAIITSGGVALEEVDFRTMQSRRIQNLYLVGDVLNIDRPSGGYSLQLCWTTGWVAGSSAAEAVA
ncbi:MAG: flavoprotein [Candidatus Parcubacteria bacterium]|nr:flavoprotein [Candidatus Parcubacteria bacterium]